MLTLTADILSVRQKWISAILNGKWEVAAFITRDKSIMAYHLFHDQYRAQTAPQRATLKQTNRNTFAENPARAGSNK